MANSNLLKEAIADAKAVRETAIANAKIALEEAFTPRLQSILSQKLQQEMEDAEVSEEVNEEEVTEAEEVNEEEIEESTEEVNEEEVTEGTYNAEGEEEITAESEEEKEAEEVDEALSVTVSETEEEEEAEVSEGDDEDSEEEVEESWHEEESEDDEAELDLESIIKELEAELSEEEEVEEELDGEEEEEVKDIADDAVASHEDDLHNEEDSEESEESEEEDLDEEIDLNEILREMGYGEEEEEESEEEVSEEVVEETSELDAVKAELGEAIATIKELKSTINEVNLLNAKLLYTNKLFRAYDLNNDQKMKVVETLDRTGNVREVKLVYSTLAESFKFNGTARKQKQSAKINESFASKPVASTAPSKEVITESTNTIAERFKKLANIK